MDKKFWKFKKKLHRSSTAIYRQYFQNFCKKNNIKLIFASTNNHTCNGISERINTSINEIIRINYSLNNLKTIEERIYTRLNHNYNAAIKMTPFTRMFFKSSLDNSKIQNLPKSMQIANENSQINMYKNNIYSNKRRKIMFINLMKMHSKKELKLIKMQHRTVHLQLWIKEK
ncbi:hypothetical protein DMUE_5523 [Dictyocoela muelleri]|nr:hypothetical protein DMUE_5523 [Dictyocoela muelleri]